MTFTISDKSEQEFENCIIAFSGDDRFIFPGVKRYSDVKRLAIGAHVFGAIGRADDWVATNDRVRLQWTRTHTGRYASVTVTSYTLTDDDTGESCKRSDIIANSIYSGDHDTTRVHVVD